MPAQALYGSAAGLFAGMMALSMMSRLLILVVTMRQEKTGWGYILAATLFCSGTWAVLAVLFGTCFLFRDDAPAWLPWFMAALWVWVVGWGGFVAYTVLRPRRPPVAPQMASSRSAPSDPSSGTP